MRPAFARFTFPPALDTEPRPHWPLGATAQWVVLTHVRRMLSLRDAAWNADPDSVRRLRVAARRARTALADFAALFDRGQVHVARKALGELTERLGTARDLDVVADLAGTMAGERPDVPGLQAAQAAVLEARLDARTDLHAALRDFELSGWPSRLVTCFAGAPIDLWRFVDLRHLLHDGEGAADR